jgi:hypothetical protein
MFCLRNIAIALLLAVALAGCDDLPSRHALVGPRREALTQPPSAQAIDDAVALGLEYLLTSQNSDGSWGSDMPKPVSVLAPVPGAPRAFRVGTTSLCIMALCEAGQDTVETDLALLRARDYLVATLPRLRREDRETIYSVWGHALSVQALIRLSDRFDFDAEMAATIDDRINDQLRMLDRLQSVIGGWAYYRTGRVYSRPHVLPMSFTTGTIMIALHEARQAGYDVSDRMVTMGLVGIRKARYPDFAYSYGIYPVPYPEIDLHKPAGSLARSQVCNAAMYLWGDEHTTLPIIRTWLDRIVARQGWLSVARKTQDPHSSYWANSGYFFFYGFYYASICMDLVEPAHRRYYQEHLAEILLPLQEPSGCWWDFPLYQYHKAYGTAFAVMTLNRCRYDLASSPVEP